MSLQKLNFTWRKSGRDSNIQKMELDGNYKIEEEEEEEVEKN